VANEPTRWGVDCCPTCGRKSMVVDSRPNAASLGAIRRRRRCLPCNRRWTTIEVLPDDAHNTFFPSERARLRVIAAEVKALADEVIKLVSKLNEKENRAMATAYKVSDVQQGDNAGS
jgi:transcriptional regulator NrdR family protein